MDTDKEYVAGIQDIRKRLKDTLKPDRYEHSLSVSFTSICLAMRYGEDIKKAELAGLIHDIAKRYSNKEIIERCKEAKISISDELMKSPNVIHAEYGYYLAQEDLQIEDEYILSAVRYHTLGRPDMTLLEKIVFTADYIEARREKQPRLKELRAMAFTDLDRCVYEMTKDTFAYLEANQMVICEPAIETFNYYKNIMEERHD